MCKKILLAVMLTLGLCLALMATASAQAPNTIMYQGRLTNAAGAALSNDTATVLFSIYAAATGGSAVWSASYPCSTDVNGVFTKELGPMALTVFDGARKYLSLKVRADNEMTPRQLLSSAPYSYRTQAVPGVAFIASTPANNYRALPSLTTALDSISIIVPSAGYIYVAAHADILLNHSTGTQDQAHFQVSATRASINYSGYGFAHPTIAAGAATGIYVIPADVSKVFTVAAAGTFKYYANGRMFDGYDASDAFFDLQLTAFFFPMAYGTVNQPASPVDEDTDSALPGGESAVIK